LGALDVRRWKHCHARIKIQLAASFWSLIATQFQGAFNENALKFLTIYLILALVKDNAQRDRLEFLVGVLFAAPFIFFSLSGGYLADRFSKRSVTLWTKVFEIGVMLLAVLSLAGPNFPLALAAIFLVCTQGALFGPSKYGLLPSRTRCRRKVFLPVTSREAGHISMARKARLACRPEKSRPGPRENWVRPGIVRRAASRLFEDFRPQRDAALAKTVGEVAATKARKK